MENPIWRRSGMRLVEVKCPSEILATLDQDGKLDGLPFMPEMLAYCGSRIRVYRRADRTCVVGHGFRRMKNAVFLQESRCNGAYHDMCHRACTLFWKNAWLRPADSSQVAAAEWSARDIAAAETLRQLPTRAGARYLCQSTELESATSPLHRWDIRPLLYEVSRRELSVLNFLRIVMRTLTRRIGGGVRDSGLKGYPGKKSRGNLDLKHGEWVEIKPLGELRQNLDEKGRNCGLGFPPTMQHAIGQRYRVAFPVRRIILEQTGTMVELNNTVALDGLLCEGVCAANCPRAEYLYCRESWLRRVPLAGDHRA